MNIFYSTGMNSEKYGGIEKMLVCLSKALSKRGHKIFLQYETLPRNQTFINDIQNEGGEIVVIKTMGRLIGGFLDIYKCLKKNKIQIVHATFSLAKDLCVLAGRLYGAKKVICHYRNISDDNQRTGLRLWLTSNFSDANLAISKAVKENIIKKGASQKKTHVVYNGVSIPSELKSKDEVCGLLGFEVSPFILMSIAWDSPVKGVDLLLEAVHIVANKFTDVKLWVIGSACNEKNKALASKLNIEKNIVWWGVRDDIPVLMSCCDVYIQPSRSEAFSRTGAEAMAAGKPVVAFKIGGIPEVIDDNVTGILAEPENVASLSNSILCLLEDSELREKMGKAGRERVSRLFNLNREVEQVIEYYEKPI